jgi:hypothetical protein
MDYRIIVGAILLLTGIILEVVYSPRLEFVKNKVLLFHNVPFTEKRIYKILF